MQTWQWNYGTLTLHKVQWEKWDRHNGRFEVETPQRRQGTSEMQTWQWNCGTLTLHVQCNNGTGTMEDLKWKPRGGREPLKCKPGSGTMEP